MQMNLKKNKSWKRTFIDLYPNHCQFQTTITKAPSHGWVANKTFYNPSCFTSSTNYALPKYSFAITFMKLSALLSGTKLTVHPPHPAPVNRLPIAPFFKAKLVNSSSSGDEHSYKSLQDDWLSFINYPMIAVLASSLSSDWQTLMKCFTL